MRNKKRIKRMKRKNLRKRRRTANLCGLFFVCFLLVFGIVYFSLYLKVNQVPKDKICSGVLIGQVDVSGLTAEQAQKAVDEKQEEYRKLNFTFAAGEKSASASLEELGFDISKEEKLIKKAVEYGNDGSVWSRYSKLRKLKKEQKVFQPTYQVDQEKTAKLLKERVSGLFSGASDASITRTNGSFVITDEVEGLELNSEATIKEINKFLNKKWEGTNGTIKVVSKIHKPKVTRADLETIQDKLGSFSTYCGSGQTRVTNIIRGAELINGTVLMPGEEFSAGQTMMPFTKENQYVEAGAYENGEVVQSLAGGICQVSTTLYNAALNAELDILSRQPHSMIVAYVKPSRDAAIAGDYKDLKIRNNYDTPIFIEGFILNGNVNFNIYGKETRPAGRTLEFISESVSEKDPEKEFSEQSDAKLGQIKENISTHRGIEARLWKVVYENGKEVSRDIINRSTYKSSPTKVTVGTASSNAEYTKIVRDAIKTQDEAKIKAAIKKVEKMEKEAAEKAKEKEDPVSEPKEEPKEDEKEKEE